MRRLSRAAAWGAGVLAMAGCADDRSPREASLVVVPVVVHDLIGHEGGGPELVESTAAAVAIEVASYFRATGLTIADVGETRVVPHAGRAAVLVDFTEAAAPCDAVTDDLDLTRERGEVLVVFGGHINSTDPFRPLYGVSCGGRSLGCSPHPLVGGVVLVDSLTADEIAPAVVAAHELGHVLGLRHPFEPDCGGAVAPEGAANLMALERDAARLGAIVLPPPSLAALQLTEEQIRTIGGGS